MEVALVAIGSRGDLEPFLALGELLRARGHDVRIATHGDAADLVRAAGLDFRPLPGSAAAFFQQEQVVAAMRASPRLARLRGALARPQHAQAAAAAMRILRRYVDDAIQGADVAVVGPAMHETMAVEPLPVPHVLVSWYPATATSAFPALGAPELPLGGAYRRLTHALVDRWLERGRRPAVAAGRALAGLEGTATPVDPALTMYLVSAAVVPTPTDWPAGTVLTGPWRRAMSVPDDGPPDSWWAQGPAPVVVSFGSLWPVIPESWVEEVVDAAATATGRVVVVGGPEIRTDDRRVRCTMLDFDARLPQAAALVHHGGFGTGTAALRAGVPQVVTPLFVDHPWWAHRMRRIGVAPAPLRLRATRTGGRAGMAYARRLRHALRRVDDGMRTRAVRVAAVARLDGGVHEAADLLERWATRSAS